MEFAIVTVPSARRPLKKLPKDVRHHLIEALQTLRTQPEHGEQLNAPWRAFRSFHTKYKNTEYRVVYEVDGSNKQIIVRYAASRENFYKELRKLRLKPMS